MDDASELPIVEKSKRKVRSMWSAEAEELLLVLWSQNVDSLRSSKKNFAIVTKMSSKMEEMGYPYTGYEIKVKIHNLTNKYRIEKKRVSEGLISVWPLYQSVNKILGVYQPAFQKIDDISQSAEDNNYFSNPTPSDEVGSDDDNYFENINENQQNVVEEEEVLEPTLFSKNSEPLFSERMYLRSINRNMEILIELHKRSQSMEKERNATLRQLLIAFKNDSRAEANENFDEKRPCKKMKFSKHDNINEDQYEESFVNYILKDDPLDQELLSENCDNNQQEDINGEDENLPASTQNQRKVKKSLDMKIKQEFLKTKQLERQFLIEKHNLQMDILKLELEAKKKLNS